MATGGAELIALVAGIVALGIVSQVLGDRFRVPSIIFLLSVGLLLGPLSGFVLPERIVTVDTFGGALSAIVGLAVAIIVFEGAFHLRIEDLRQASSASFRLVTLGAAISLVGTATVVHYALATPWDIAFLIGALLVATGPTVISPILDVVPVRDRVGTALETEGIVNDVTAAVLAVVVFEVVVLGEGFGTVEIVAEFLTKIGVGLLVGTAVAGALWYLLRYVDLSPGNAPRNARLLVLAGALVAYGLANSWTSEAGIAAVATAGIIVGNLDIPYEAEITEFKGDVTLIVLSFVFIALAALLNFQDLPLDLGGLAVVVVVALVFRPLLVFLSTTGDRFTREERVFMSLVGPRGIIPASVATLFAVRLQAEGLDAAATTLVGTVFLVIFATVVFEGGLARYFAEYLDVIPMRALIVGGGKVGRDLSTRLEARGENVVIVEDDQSIVTTARNEGFTVHVGDGTNSDVLRSAGAENASTVVATTGDDDVNLLVAQLAATTFDTDRVISRVNRPENVDAFADLDVDTISSTEATSWAIDNRIERPALWNWMTELGRSGDVQEFEVTAKDVAGKTIADLSSAIPEGCLIALVCRNGENKVPDGDFELQQGDRITLVGLNESVQGALERFHPAD
ncbi:MULTISPECIES: cation:proton antiporter domain-containing protein [Halococcus]|uniref:Sodium/proton antiporter, cpa1 family protein n=1 Tax=Halococcus salifodinae DSM 8989 TaxID=1227456 RepID=M0NDW3_9EURY|nr:MULTISPECIES: cation:proton antiporter [Halococcus]EMA55284.1 sodium/proton antiporter, cpa1 family protein [Halococcus salifodinae DSM 8989]